MASFGSGAGSDALSFQVTEEILSRKGKALSTEDYISRRVEIDYAQYARMRGKITLK
jgi:hydroxymethylglutaryl-CoA synthase